MVLQGGRWVAGRRPLLKWARDHCSWPFRALVVLDGVLRCLTSFERWKARACDEAARVDVDVEEALQLVRLDIKLPRRYTRLGSAHVIDL